MTADVRLRNIWGLLSPALGGRGREPGRAIPRTSVGGCYADEAPRGETRISRRKDRTVVLFSAPWGRARRRGRRSSGARSSLASRVGLSGLSIGRLAQELDLSKSGLFSHFHSKEALQIQVLEYGADRFVEDVVKPALEAPRGIPPHPGALRQVAHLVSVGPLFRRLLLRRDGGGPRRPPRAEPGPPRAAPAELDVPSRGPREGCRPGRAPPARHRPRAVRATTCTG